MREALGNAFVMNIVITIVVILIGVVVSSLSYTKAYKVKNMIIGTIEEHNGWTLEAQSEVDQNLASIGYRLNRNGVQTCTVDEVTGDKAQVVSSNYRVCVVPYQNAKGTYYRVTSYMYFDLPVIGDMFEFPVHGETKTFYNMDYFE